MSKSLKYNPQSKNINIYWISATGLLASWFTFGIKYMPPYVFKRTDTRIHLFGSALTAITCTINTLSPPSTYSPKQRYIHGMLGKIGLIASFIGITGGMIRIYSLYKETKEINGGMIGLTYAACAQAYYTFKVAKTATAMKELKESTKSEEYTKKMKELRAEHIRWTHNLFYGACLGPFWTRALDPEEVPIGAVAKKIQDITGLSDTVMLVLRITGIAMIPGFMVSQAERCLETKCFI